MNKPSLITRIRNRLKDRKGQSTTEYVLILAIVVMMASKMKKQISGIVEGSTKQIDKAMGEFESQ